MDKEIIKQADTKLNKAILNFFNEGKDFWTILASQYKRVPVENLQTVMTRVTEKGVELLYDPEIIIKAKKDELAYYIIHESLHLIYRHSYRFAVSDDVVDLATLKRNIPSTRTPKIPVKSADIATDLIVNRDASDVLGAEVVEQYGITANMKQFSPMNYANSNSTWGCGSRKTMYNVQSEDLEQEIRDTYTEVDMPKDKLQQLQISGGGGNDGESGDQEGDGGSDDSGNGGKDSNSDGEGKSNGQSNTKIGGKKVNHHIGVDTSNPLQKQLGQHFIEDMVKNAAKQVGSKGQGHLPASVQQELEMLNNPPKKDWKALLSNYVNASIPAQSTRTWANLNRRFPYLLKGKKKRRVPLIGLVMDTSGSVSDAAIAAFYREIDSIRKILKTDIELIQCDAEISDHKVISYKEKLTWSVAGRGGTEFIPALEYFDKTKRVPDVVVFFTDLQVSDSDVPDEPRKYKIIWVSVDKEMCDHFSELGKYGTFIHLDVDSLDEEVANK